MSNESMFEMDRRIKELEHAITANDDYLQKVEALNAELLAALKETTLVLKARLAVPELHPTVVVAEAAIAKAEAFKP